MAKEFSCPNCGNLITPATNNCQLIVCGACNSSLFYDNGNIENHGKMATLAEEPLLLELNHRYKHQDWYFTPIGRVRYDYGEGVWDEYYVLSDNGAGNWVSVDEGDVAIEKLVQSNVQVTPFEQLRVGDAVTLLGQRMTVTEKNSCRCVGAQGELPFPVSPDDGYDYIDLLGPKRASFTIEYQKNGIECFKGNWVDPFEIVEV